MKKERNPNSHKGDHGKAFIIAGSEQYSGAATLTSQACEAILRTGADLTVACTPEQVAWLVNEKLPEAITIKYKHPYFKKKHAAEIAQKANTYDATLIGPGMGKQAKPFIQAILPHLQGPTVIDADAIRAATIQDVTNAIFTPHQDEFNHLLQNSNIKRNQLQEHLKDNVILLKGPNDTIISKNKTKTNKTGNAVMTKGGTGDILAGLTTGYLAKGNTLFQSAYKAAQLNGKTADMLEKQRGETFIPSDILNNLHKILNKDL